MGMIIHIHMCGLGGKQLEFIYHKMQSEWRSRDNQKRKVDDLSPLFKGGDSSSSARRRLTLIDLNKRVHIYQISHKHRKARHIAMGKLRIGRLHI